MLGEAKVWDYVRTVVDAGMRLVELLKAANESAGLPFADFAMAVQELLTGRVLVQQTDLAHLYQNNVSAAGFQNLKRSAEAMREGARTLDLDVLGQEEVFVHVVDDIIANGAVPLLRGLTVVSAGDDQVLAPRAQKVLDALKRLGIDQRIIANDTSDKLTAFFVDGTYNFTYILFPTAVLQNGAAGSGTCVISSNYDVNTKLLDKKSLINNFLDPLPQTILQSFDIHSNSIVMDTYGTSLSGKFGIKEDGSALNTVETGYDATYGTFTKFHKFYIKTQIGFLISNYNKDTDELHSVWFYSIVPKATQMLEPIQHQSLN